MFSQQNDVSMVRQVENADNFIIDPEEEGEGQ